MKSLFSKNNVFIIIITLILISVYLAEILFQKQENSAISYNQNKPSIGGEFTLIDQNEQVFNSKALKGTPSLVYFGFTYCPDVCPASINKVMEVIKILNKYNIKINFVFITLDPKRDTAKTLNKYFKNHKASIIALTGSKDQLKEVSSLFKVYSAINGNEENENYLVDHSSFLYLLDQAGVYRKHFDPTASVHEIVEYIRINLRNH